MRRDGPGPEDRVEQRVDVVDEPVMVESDPGTYSSIENS